MVKMRFSLAALLLLAAVSCPLQSFGQDKGTSTGTPAAPESAVAVAPEAISALEDMGKYLRSLKAFAVTSTTLTDEIVGDGIKLQFGGTASLKVRRPDRLQAETVSDRKQRKIYYDGKKITLYGARVKYYATVPAPPTVGETIDILAKKYGVAMPLVDLFYWGTDAAPTDGIKFAAYIGPATIDGVKTDQFVFRQEGIDWQIWIQQGATPVPRKLVITTTSEPTHPDYIATMRWDLAPKLDDKVFAFKPPSGAMRIPLQTADGKVETAQ
jgi:hypothetical protein